MNKDDVYELIRSLPEQDQKAIARRLRQDLGQRPALPNDIGQVLDKFWEKDRAAHQYLSEN